MTTATKDPPAFPAGEYVAPASISSDQVDEFVARLESFPERLAKEVAGLSERQLDMRYRNWTIRQIVHHLADSHMNAMIRIKCALTENGPTIKPYDETRWAETPDARSMPIADSLAIVSGVHRRLCRLIDSLDDEDLRRSYQHPQYGTTVRIEEALAQYAWHADHHLAQIRWVKENRVD
jgi:hypothetical protein